MDGLMDLLSHLKNIPQNRLLMYLIALGLIPLCLVFFFFWSDLEKISNLEYSLESVHDMALKVERKQAENIATRNYYQGADHFYIDKELETLKFLQPEIEGLGKVVENPNFIEDDLTRKRLEFLTSKQNQLTFSETNVQTSPSFQEVTESSLHPVEVDLNDLKKILTLVEGREVDGNIVPPNKPQLIFLEFKLEKKSVRDNSQVFELNTKLLKREFP
jgi:hypothetical protein